MKKVLATLLALAMIVALAVPAFAYDPTNDNAIAKVEFDKNSYKWDDIVDLSVEDGMTSIELDKLITAYDANGNRVAFDEVSGDSVITNENKVRFAVSNTNLLVVDGKVASIDTGSVTKGGTVTLQAITAKGKIATTKITLPEVAAAGSTAKNYRVPVGKEAVIDGTTLIKMVPLALGSAFTEAQGAGFEYWISTPGNSEWYPIEDGSVNGFTVTDLEDGWISIDVDGDVTDAGDVLKVKVGNKEFPGATQYKYFNVTAVGGSDAVAPKLPIEKKVEVGSMTDLKAIFDGTWSIEAYGQNQADIETMMMGKLLACNDGHQTFKAIAPGVLTLVCTNSADSDTMKLTIGEGNKADPSIAAKAEVEVGGEVKLVVKNLVVGSEVKWASADETIATVADGVVKGVKEGTVKVTATIDGADELVCEITVKAATATAPGATTNPATGDSLFANLF